MRIFVAIIFITICNKVDACNLQIQRGLAFDDRTTNCWVTNPETLPETYFYHNSVYYKVVSDEKKTCEVSNDGITDESGNPVNRVYKGKIMIPPYVIWEGQRYSVVRVGNSAFNGCTVTEVHLPSTVTSIGSKAFFGTRFLKEINLPNGLSDIGQMAFTGSGLHCVLLPAGTHQIGDGAFALCDSLSAITCMAETPPPINSHTFHRQAPLNTVTLTVPPASQHLYVQAEGWKLFNLSGTKETK